MKWKWIFLVFQWESVFATCPNYGQLPVFDAEGVCHDPATQGTCQDGEWLVSKDSQVLQCVKRPCRGQDEIFYDGECHELYEDGVCGLEPGLRLYVTSSGEGVCDCDDGWVRGPDNHCHQLFTQGYCEGDKILHQKMPNFLFPGELRAFKMGLRRDNVKCLVNPCGDPRVSLPHRYLLSTSDSDTNPDHSWGLIWF